jgi:hypothetical protein
MSTTTLTIHAHYIGLPADNEVDALQRLYTRYGFAMHAIRVIHAIPIPLQKTWYIVAVPECRSISLDKHWEKLHDVFNLSQFPNLPYVDIEDIRGGFNL